MGLAECLLVVIGLSFNVFLASEYEGTMLRRINRKKVAVLCGIFFLWQILSMLAGSMVSNIAFFRKSSSEDLKMMCYILASIIFLLLAVYMLRKAWKREIIQERLSDIRFKRVFLEASVIGFFTFLSGIGCGFLGIRVGAVCGIIACATVLAVIAGIFVGFHQGCKFRTGVYGAGGLIFLAEGIAIILRHL